MRGSAITILALVLASGTAWAQQQQAQGPSSATANFMTSDGKPAGSAQLVETPKGLLVKVSLMNIPAGAHGFHIHETGACDAPGFQSAGGHFNPAGVEHGFLSTEGAHAGDLPNIYADAQGRVTAEYLVQDVSLGGEQGDLLDDNGSALVVHAQPDDYQTDPAGASGARIACGVITR